MNQGVTLELIHPNRWLWGGVRKKKEGGKGGNSLPRQQLFLETRKKKKYGQPAAARLLAA